MLLSLHHPLALTLTVLTTLLLVMALLGMLLLLLLMLMLLLGSVRGGRVQGVLVFHYVTISRHLKKAMPSNARKRGEG